MAHYQIELVNKHGNRTLIGTANEFVAYKQYHNCFNGLFGGWQIKLLKDGVMVKHREVR